MHFNSTNSDLLQPITIHFQLEHSFVFNKYRNWFIFSFREEIDSINVRGTAKKINTRYNRRNAAN